MPLKLSCCYATTAHCSVQPMQWNMHPSTDRRYGLVTELLAANDLTLTVIIIRDLHGLARWLSADSENSLSPAHNTTSFHWSPPTDSSGNKIHVTCVSVCGSGSCTYSMRGTVHTTSTVHWSLYIVGADICGAAHKQSLNGTGPYPNMQ